MNFHSISLVCTPKETVSLDRNRMTKLIKNIELSRLLGLHTLCNTEKILFILYIRSYGFYRSSGFVFVQSFGHFFGHKVFYLFGPLDSV